MKAGSVVAGRYRLKRSLGAGATAVTWLAADAEGGKEVVLKLLSFGAMEDWKALELFEREAGVLRNLHHEGIPAYLDCFHAGEGDKSRFVLVQERVDGSNLAARVEAGWRGTEEEICRIGAGLLSIVSYIHSLRPPIIHRDINPKNVILRDDGAVFLVDFGGVQDAVRLASSSGATVIGTPGYMPMEQFVGKASVRSDLYGVAATLLFLLTHRNPQDLPTKDMKIDVRAALELGPGLLRVLDSWLEPDEAKRTLSVARAVEILEGRSGVSMGPEGLFEAGRYMKEGGEEYEPQEPLPSFSRIQIRRQGTASSLLVPERGSAGAAAAMGGFSFFWLGFVAFWTFATVAARAWPMAFFSIPFWAAGIFLVRRVLKGFFAKTVILIDPADGLRFERRGLLGRKEVQVPLREVGQARVCETGATVNRRAITTLELPVGARIYRFGENLSDAEKQWLQRNINARVRECRDGNC